MSTPRQEAAKEELRNALRRVLSYKPPPKTSKRIADPKDKYRRDAKKRGSNVPVRS